MPRWWRIPDLGADAVTVERDITQADQGAAGNLLRGLGDL